MQKVENWLKENNIKMWDREESLFELMENYALAQIEELEIAIMENENFFRNDEGSSFTSEDSLFSIIDRFKNER